MLNLLKDYIPDSLPGSGAFVTNPNLSMKVDEQGRMLPFFGNTVVFDLSDGEKAELQQLQEPLYRAAPGMLAEPIEAATFHMTLHDLVNSPRTEADFWERCDEAEARAKAMVEGWQGLPDIPMRATWIFNMVNTSLVLGLEPVGDRGWAQLSGMYRVLETVAPLGYKLTPHITLAYFRPGTYGEEAVQALRGALRAVDLRIGLRMEDLLVDRFTSMNGYALLGRRENKR